MFWRKSFLPLLFAGLASLLAQGAMAQDLPPYDTGVDFSSSWGGTWGSTISCSKASGANVIDFTTLTQSATVTCNIAEDDGTILGPAACELNISYSRTAGLTTAGVAQCIPSSDNTTSTLTDVAFCGNASRGLVVSGTLNCNPQNLTGSSLPAICGGNTSCTANLDGITSVPNGQCSTVFPASPNNSPFLAGQVLAASVTTEGSSCNGKVLALSSISTRFCDSGSFDPTVPASCGTTRHIISVTGKTISFLPVAIAVSPQTINVKCNPNNNGNVSFTIFGSNTVDVTKINVPSLKLEGVPPSSCSSPTDVNHDGFLDLSCTVPSCPNLGPNIAANENPDLTVNIQVTGNLSSATGAGTLIEGTTLVGTSGN